MNIPKQIKLREEAIKSYLLHSEEINYWPIVWVNIMRCKREIEYLKTL